MSKSSGDVPHGTALLDLDLTATPLVPKRPMADSTTALFDVTASPQGTYLSASTDMPNLLCDSILLKTSMGTSLSTSVSAHNDGTWGAVVPGILYVTSYKDLMRAGPTSASMFNGYVSVAQELDGVELPFAAENGSLVKYVALEDNEVTQLRDWLPAIFGFIDQHARSGKAVVIFCQAGKSRSVSFALAFMMREYKISTEQALETLRRGGYYRADPNITFLMQLRALEPLLHSWTVPC